MNICMPEAAARWIVGGHTGLSSRTIWRHMVGLPVREGLWGMPWPVDAGDLGRCLRLLALVPEWQSRMGEMARYSPAWAALVARWDDLAQSMADEVGIDWSKGWRAPQTDALIKSLLRAAIASRTTPAQEHEHEKGAAA